MIRRLPAAVLAVVAGIAVATPATAPPAAAHSVLTATAPKARSTVTEPRPTVTLTFNEAVQAKFARVVVTDPAGDRVNVGKPDVTDTNVTQRIRPFPAAGRYRVGWRVVSADGHPVDGTFTFTVRDSAVTATSPTSSATTSAATSTPPTATGRPQAQQSLLQRHTTHLLIGLVIAVLSSGFLICERRRRHD